MANDGTDIDLYADDLEFNQDTEFNDQNLDLYDDVITPSGKNSNSNTNNPIHEDDFTSNQDSNNAQNIENVSNSANENQNNLSATTKKIGIYVGNLTWWTTDQDIIESINGIGVSDIIEVKFFENRANGQSKGFCVVSLGSESSVKNVIEKLPKTEIHAQNPVVTPCNKQNLNHFEMQSRKNNPGHANNNNNNMNNGSNLNNMNNVSNGPSQMRPPYGGNPLMPGSNSGHMRPPLINRPQRPNGPLLQAQPRMQLGGLTPQGPYGQGMQNQNLWNHQMGPQSGNGSGPPGNRNPRGGPMHGSPQGGPRPGLGGPMNMRMPNSGGLQRNSSQPLLRAPGPPNDRLGHNGQMGQDWDHGVHGSVMPSGPGPMNQPNPMNMDQNMHGGPAPHVNPAFFGGPGQAQDPYNRSSGSSLPYSNDYGRPPLNPVGSDSSLMMQLSESEFEELLAKNCKVSSNAISRAIADSSVGDFSSAIETLVTAISLIKQSKVGNDERCKILISSLQDTLHNMETKSYSSSRKDRPRSRERDRSRDRSRREKRRDRSRSRDYRSRSREKRGRDRDRERDYRRERSRDRYRPERDYYREDSKNEK